MRGYLATVIGALFVITVTYIGLGKVLGARIVEPETVWLGAVEPTVKVSRQFIDVAGASIFFALAGSVGATVVLLVNRSRAVVETGLAVLLALFVGLGVLSGALMIAELDVSGWLATTAVLVVMLVLPLLAARWLGLRWHARRRGGAAGLAATAIDEPA